ncbi:hypothetical protein TIFTF001_025245 [Ficus carica]|uniref:Uncharacterized protein n=1 Tax=Ficus carica TaxID=3494 RepID=A0AA88ANW5_FICCA|nr:hypothetical protein TIFTF001_025245 [Ficus carica]
MFSGLCSRPAVHACDCYNVLAFIHARTSTSRCKWQVFECGNTLGKLWGRCLPRAWDRSTFGLTWCISNLTMDGCVLDPNLEDLKLGYGIAMYQNYLEVELC